MIARKTLLDFLESTQHKVTPAVQKAIDALPDNFTIVKLGEALVAADGNAKSEGALLAMAFAQHVLDAGGKVPEAPAKPKAAPERSRETGAVSPGPRWESVPAGARVASVSIARF